MNTCSDIVNICSSIPGNALFARNVCARSQYPSQVVSKSCKVVPVMLVGKFVHGKSYPWVEYFEVRRIN